MPGIPTQQLIEIAGIKDGIVILKNGGYRMILQVTAVNFDLKSEQEQNSLVFQYQSFLNSLHFPIQIVVRSKRLDLEPYLKKIKSIAANQSNDLINLLATDYVGYVEKLIGLANIMKKSFYVVVPHDPVNLKQLNFLDRVFKKKGMAFDHIKVAEADYKSYTDTLRERANVIAGGLGTMGLHCVQLSSQELIELFYEVYNPDLASKERLVSSEQLLTPIVVSKAEVNSLPSKEERARADMIDNTAVVIEERKQEAQQRKQETQKQAERVERAPQGAANQAPPNPAPTPLQPAPVQATPTPAEAPAPQAAIPATVPPPIQNPISPQTK